MTDHGGVADELVEESGVPRSLRDRLRQRREEMRADNTLDLLIPGYDGELAVRYRPISEDQLQRFADRLTKKTGGEALLAARQLIIAAAETVLVREDGELRPLTDDNGAPIIFDARLGEIMEIEADRAVDIVAEVFSPDGVQPLAVNAHGGALINWMQGNDAEVDARLLGE